MEFPNQITQEQCNNLESDVTKVEIKKAVWDCGTDKAPGPDGFTFGFFRHFWYLVDREIYDAVRNFIYIKDDEDLMFLPKEPSSGFGTGSPSVSLNTKPLKANKEHVELTADSGGSPKPELFVVHPGSVAAWIKDKKCKTREGRQGPLLRGSLLLGIPPPVLLLKDANACHLKISAITPLAWKNHLANHIDLELLDLHDRCYARQAVVDNVVNRRERARDEECEGLRVKCEAVMTDFEKNPAVDDAEESKWAGYQQSLSTLESKVTALETEKARLEAVKVSIRKEVEELKQDRREVVSKVVPYAVMELIHSDDIVSLLGKLVSSAIVYGRCK
nr:RNA-directed DNA polymerase, eukaryota, reverse transcriptase zinc-binding domain protein [Tanacetum cinerariifolium]